MYIYVYTYENAEGKDGVHESNVHVVYTNILTRKQLHSGIHFDEEKVISLVDEKCIFQNCYYEHLLRR